MSTQKNNNPKNEMKFSAKALDSLNALKISENVSGTSQKSIFKPECNDKSIRSKYRNKLIAIKKIENEGKFVEVQKGLIPTFLLQIKKAQFAEAKKTFAEISELCKKVYIAEDSFKNANDYFSGNRSPETQDILKTFIAIANEM